MATPALAAWLLCAILLLACGALAHRNHRLTRQLRATADLPPSPAGVAGSVEVEAHAVPPPTPLQDVVVASGELLLVSTLGGTVTFASGGADQLVGLSATSLVGRSVVDLVRPEDRESLSTAAQQAAVASSQDDVVVLCHPLASDGNDHTLEARVRRLEDDGSIDGLVWSLRDVGENATVVTDEQTPRYDRVTGLPNRALLVKTLDQALGRAWRSRSRLAAVIVQTAGFRDAWETFGHRAAGEVVTTAAARLVASLRPGDVVAHTGMEEFTLLLDGIRDEGDALDLVDRALSRLGLPVAVGSETTQLVTRAGIAVAREGSDTTAEEVLHQATVAVSLAGPTGDGDGVPVVYDESMEDVATARRFDVSVALQHAIAAGEIRVVYQPIVDVTSLRPVGFEALARWDHPDLGPISPATFIPIAEDSGLIVDLGRHVLDVACRQLVAWHRLEPWHELRMGVNVSPRQLAADGVVEDLSRTLESTGLSPGHLVLEITESALHTDLATVQHRLGRFRNLGVKLAMDDFGTGYSSLAYLRHLPVDIVKIDQSFIADGSDAGRRVLTAVVEIGRQLDLDTVAEGIEDEDQLASVRASGCANAQGYLIARPLEAAAVVDYLAAAAEVAAAAADPLTR